MLFYMWGGCGYCLSCEVVLYLDGLIEVWIGI